MTKRVFSPLDVKNLMRLRKTSPMTWGEFTKNYYPGHNEKSLQNIYYRERKRQLEQEGLEEDSDVPEDESENSVEEGEVRDEEPLSRHCALESERVLCGDGQTTETGETIQLVRKIRGRVDRTKTTTSSQMEMNTVTVIPKYQDVTSKWLKRIVCVDSGRSRQEGENVVIVQNFPLPSPPAKPHSPNRPPSKKRKLSSGEVESGCRIAQAAMALQRARFVNPESTNANMSPMTASDGEQAMTDPIPFGTKAYKSLTPVPNASGKTLNEHDSLTYEMLPEHRLVEIFEKAQRYSLEKARADWLQERYYQEKERADWLQERYSEEKERADRFQREKTAATREDNEAQAQLSAEMSKTKLLPGENAELEHTVLEREDQIKSSSQNVLDVGASLKDALDKASEAGRKLRESRRENEDKTKQLEMEMRSYVTMAIRRLGC